MLLNESVLHPRRPHDPLEVRRSQLRHYYLFIYYVGALGVVRRDVVVGVAMSHEWGCGHFSSIFHPFLMA